MSCPKTWCADDQPIWLKTRNGKCLSTPYSQEINDSAAIIGRVVGASEFANIVGQSFSCAN